MNLIFLAKLGANVTLKSSEERITANGALFNFSLFLIRARVRKMTTVNSQKGNEHSSFSCHTCFSNLKEYKTI